MGNTSYKVIRGNKTYEGNGLEELFNSVARNNRLEYKGNLPAFLKVSQQKKYIDRIVKNTKEREAILKKNGVSANEIPGKLVDFMIEELNRNVNENSYSSFGKSNGMMMFGNSASLSQMSGPFGGSRFGSSCDSTAFGRRHRKQRKSSFGKKSKTKKRRSSSFGRKGKKGKKVRA
jgi:hypothetical protein